MSQNYSGGGEGAGSLTAIALAAFGVFLILWVGWDWYFWVLKPLGLVFIVFALSVLWHNIQVIFGFGHGNPHVN